MISNDHFEPSASGAIAARALANAFWLEKHRKWFYKVGKADK